MNIDVPREDLESPVSLHKGKHGQKLAFNFRKD